MRCDLKRTVQHAGFVSDSCFWARITGCIDCLEKGEKKGYGTFGNSIRWSLENDRCCVHSNVDFLDPKLRMYTYMVQIRFQS